MIKYAIITRTMDRIYDDYVDYQIGKDKRNNGIAIINISESDEVLYNALKISCDDLGQVLDDGIHSTFIQYLSDRRFCFTLSKDMIKIDVENSGSATIMWTLLNHHINVSKNDKGLILETRKEDLYFI